jgi:mRNA (2'-O-methyladenosine-N6-)-methyltransferase
LFDVLSLDPPWDIHMNLPYETLTDNQVFSNLKGIDKLQGPGGLIFVWVTGRAIELGIECLDKWGYTLIEEIVWIKIN